MITRYYVRGLRFVVWCEPIGLLVMPIRVGRAVSHRNKNLPEHEGGI